MLRPYFHYTGGKWIYTNCKIPISHAFNNISKNFIDAFLFFNPQPIHEVT